MPLRASIANSLRSLGADRTDTRGPIKTQLIDYFVVSGGGGGGAFGGGGGGGGGFLIGSGFPVSSGDYFTVGVGGGGGGGSERGGRGGSSSLTGPSPYPNFSVGGGGGGGGAINTTPGPNNPDAPGARGGDSGVCGGGGGTESGGGGSGSPGSPVSNVQGQGNPGGVGRGGRAGGGGGGGVEQPGYGSNNEPNIAGKGGNGFYRDAWGIAGFAVGAGGGGGAVYGNWPPRGPNEGGGSFAGLGGSNGNGDDRYRYGSGGGNGGYLNYPANPVSPGAQVALSAWENGGCGGGGGADVSPNDGNSDGHGRSGGSGRVILRYSEYYDTLTINSGSPDIVRSDGFRVYDFKASGAFTI